MVQKIQIRIEPVDTDWGKDTEFEQIESLIAGNNRSFTDQELKRLLGSNVVRVNNTTYVNHDEEENSD